MSHAPVQVHVRFDNLLAVPTSTERANKVTILIHNSYYRVLFENMEQSIKFLINTTNTEPDKGNVTARLKNDHFNEESSASNGQKK